VRVPHACWRLQHAVLTQQPTHRSDAPANSARLAAKSIMAVLGMARFQILNKLLVRTAAFQPRRSTQAVSIAPT